MDVHKHLKATENDLAEAHKRDLAAQGKYGAEFLKYWYDEKDGAAFCLSRAPNPEAHLATHREAHGFMPDEIFEVSEGG
jgi:hypothetical protein